jgi:two-component system nitrogen regulation sensor histidine kinase GlnL
MDQAPSMHSLTLALIGFLHLALGLAVWRAKPQRGTNRLFALQTLTFAGWTFGNAFLQLRVWIDIGNMLAFASASLMPAFMMAFIIHYPDSRSRRSPWQWAVFCVGGLFALASLTTGWIVHDVRFENDELRRQPGILYPFFAAYFIAVVGAGFAVFAQKWWRARERERAQLNYYGLGLIIAGAGGITSNLILPALTKSSSFSHFGPYFGLSLVALTAHTIIRHRFMDLRVAVHRGLTFTIAMLLASVPALALFLLVGRPMLTHRRLPEAMLAIAAFLAVALLIPLTRDFAERLLDRYLYRARTNTQQLLRQASTELTHALDLTRVLSVIAATITAAVKPEGVATYLNHDGALRLSSASAVDATGVFIAPPEPATPVIAELLARREALVRDELDAEDDLRLCDALSSNAWALVLPLLSDNELVGLVAVGSKLSGDPYFSDDVDALTTLANHAGTAVKNAALYGQVVLANEYLNNIVGAMQNGVVAVDSSGIVTLINAAARETLKLPRDAVLKADDLPAELHEILDEVVDQGRETAAREVTLTLAPPSQPLLLLCTATRLHGHARSLSGAVAVFSDLTPLKELDQQRTRAENLASLQRVTQALAHEIGNPLVPIKTLTKLLPERVGDRAFADNVSRIVSREIERIERLVARLRRIAPTVDLRHSVVDLRMPMRHALEVIEAAATEQDTRLEVVFPSEPALILGDSAEIEELFLNLLTNALEAVAEQPADSRCVHVSVITDESHAIAQIRDTGRGIPADFIDRIFDPFITTKSRGSGLGLAICAGIAERHHGQLTAANAENGGAILTMTVQRAADDSKQ